MSTHYTEDINGWIILDKPQNMSSNQVLRKIQYMLKAKKAGHIGTLDPFATGVLPLAFGEATKLIPYLEGTEKTYEFTLKFGIGTNTDDTEGEICETSEIIPSKDEILSIIPSFTGKIMQIPPKFSAIHINGERAYKLARDGNDFDIPPRQITIKELKLLNYNQEQHEAYFSVTCSKGTYVRTLGKDIAKRLNTCGHLSSLRRTKNGFFDLSCTILLENLKNMVYEDERLLSLLPVKTSLRDIAVIAVSEEEATKLRHGQGLSPKAYQGFPLNTLLAALYNDCLVALVRVEERRLSPIRVFNL